VDRCAPQHLASELNVIKPFVVVTMGLMAYRALVRALETSSSPLHPPARLPLTEPPILGGTDGVLVDQASHSFRLFASPFIRTPRLLLIRTPFSGLSVSIWRLLFYLYLLAKGHDTLFVAQLASINWIAHGLAVIPAGILSDLFGRRRMFLVSYSGNILGTAALIVVGDPTALLVLAAVQGLFEGGHAIVGPPFMVEQS